MSHFIRVSLLVLVAACGQASSHPNFDGGKSTDSGNTKDRATVEDTESWPWEALPPVCLGECNYITAGYPSVFSGGGIGDVTEYSTSPSSGGACNYGETKVASYAAINVHIAPGDKQGQWNDGRICGQCAEVTASTSKGQRTAIIRIMDRCADVNCGIDLGGTAPDAIMADGFGRYRGTWRFISCAGHPEVFDGPTILFVNSGSNPFWSMVQVRNPTSPVESMAWQLDSDEKISGVFSYAGVSIENYFQVPLEVLQSGKTYTITIHYRDGSQHTLGASSTELGTPGKTFLLES
jgi:expansin (peptidoglycan-binding protein)